MTQPRKPPHRAPDFGRLDVPAVLADLPQRTVNFRPDEVGGPGSEQVQRAKAVCARCPVQRECLNYAIETGLAYGVFGGTTPQERRRVGRQPAPSAERTGPEGREQDDEIP